MHISREIKKKLESTLPNYVLEYLTEKFNEAEEYCEKYNAYKAKVDILEQELAKKNAELMSIYQNQSQGQGMGYSQHQPNTQRQNQGGMYGPQSHVWPYYPLWLRHESDDEDRYDDDNDRDSPVYRRGRRNKMRRGVPGTGPNRYEYMTNQGQGGGGSGGGSGSGSGGGGGTSSDYDYVPSPRRMVPLRNPDMPDVNPNHIPTADV